MDALTTVGKAATIEPMTGFIIGWDWKPALAFGAVALRVSFVRGTFNRLGSAFGDWLLGRRHR